MANSNGWGDGAANNSIGWGQGANNNIGWGDSHAKSWAGLTDIVGLTTDADAQAFITAAAITDPTQQSAIDTLVKGMKTDGLWSKMKAVYPFVTDNRNLFGYTEDFASGWNNAGTTVTPNTTIAPNGTLTADTALFSSTSQSYVRASNISVISGQTYTISVYVKKSSSSPASNIRITTNNTIAWNTGISQKFALTDSWQRITLSGVLNSSGTLCYILFGSTNIDGNADSTCGGNVDIWGAQLELGSTTSTYQPIATTQQAYIASQFKYNLKDPRDLDAAFRLVFNGGWTHSSTGATPNGTNGYADTYLNPNGTLGVNSIALSYYSRTQSTSFNGGAMGTGLSSISDVTYLAPYYNQVSSKFFANGIYPVNTASSANTTTTGLVIGSKTAINSRKLYLNSTLLNTNSTSYSFTYANNSFYLGALNYGSAQFFSGFQCAFSSIGDGLTDIEAANLYTRVQAFQTSLNRAII